MEMARVICGWVTHCNGTHGMRTRDSSEWHARNVELGVNECKLYWFPYKKKSVLVPVYYIYYPVSACAQRGVSVLQMSVRVPRFCSRCKVDLSRVFRYTDADHWWLVREIIRPLR